MPGWLRCGPPGPRSAGQERDSYENPHREPGHLGAQELLPEAVAGERFYAPDEAEAALAERLQRDPPRPRPTRRDNRARMSVTASETVRAAS